MKKMKYSTLIIFLFLFFCILPSQARIQKKASITSKGMIYYPSPSPSPTPIPTPSNPSLNLAYGENLANIPEDLSQDINNFDYLSLDYNVVRTPGNPSIRIDKLSGERHSRECNFKFHRVKPGDRIIYRAWIKTENYRNTDFSGAKILVDCAARVDGDIKTLDSFPRWLKYDSSIEEYVSGDNQGGYYEMEPENGIYPIEGIGKPPFSKFGVKWGTSDWTSVEWDFIIPNTWYVSKISGSRAQIQYICPNMDVREWEDEASAWIADTELYIISQ